MEIFSMIFELAGTFIGFLLIVFMIILVLRWFFVVRPARNTEDYKRFVSVRDSFATWQSIKALLAYLLPLTGIFLLPEGWHWTALKIVLGVVYGVLFIVASGNRQDVGEKENRRAFQNSFRQANRKLFRGVKNDVVHIVLEAMRKARFASVLFGLALYWREVPLVKLLLLLIPIFYLFRIYNTIRRGLSAADPSKDTIRGADIALAGAVGDFIKEGNKREVNSDDDD